MTPNEVGRLDEHPTRPTGRIEDRAPVRLNDLDHELHHRARGEELASALPLGQREFAEKIFVDLPKDVARGILGDVVELA